MVPPRIGFVTCVHPFYDLPAVVRHRDKAIAELERAGCEIVAAPVPRSVSDALAIAAELRTSDIDVVLLFFCTWVAEDITLSLVRELKDIPLLIWALPYLDRDVPMPSPMSGFIASGSNIRRLGKPFVYLVGAVTANRVEQAARSLRVGAIAARLRRARFGIVGDPCPGMIDVVVDDAQIERALGATTVHFDLDALLNAAQRSSPEQVAVLAERLTKETCGAAGPDRAALIENLRLYAGMGKLVEENRLDGYCVRCWPELRDQHQKTLCLTHSLMSRDGIVSTCEVDLPALITTYLLSQLSGTPSFSFDITGYLDEENAIQFAHCGAADPALAADPGKAQLRTHMRTGTGATVEFPFKEGTVTLAKLLRPGDGALRLFAARGCVIPSGDGTRGSVATVRPEPSAAAFLDAMVREAVEHHVVLVYGDWLGELAQFCEFTGLTFLAGPE